MPDSHPQHSADEMTPALRKALVEIGAVIPTTPQEVKLAEAQLGPEPPRSEVDAAFVAVLHALDDTKSSKPFMQLDESVVAAADNELAMAARNGTELDAETLAQIERDVAAVTRKLPQT